MDLGTLISRASNKLFVATNLFGANCQMEQYALYFLSKKHRHS